MLVSSKQNLHSSLWEGLVLGILCWQKTAKAVCKTLLLLNQKQNIIPFKLVA